MTAMSQMKGDCSSPIKDKAELRGSRKIIPDLLLGRTSNFGSRLCGIKGPSRSLLWYRPSCGKRQPAAPELPGTIAKPTRFGTKHDFDQTVLTYRLLQNNDVVKGAEVHRLGDDTVFGMRFIAHWVPPKVFPTKFRNGSRSYVISFHGLIITSSASEWIAFFYSKLSPAS